MQELVTNAVILGKDRLKNDDFNVDLFTEDVGRISARVVSGLKTRSRLALHLDTLNISCVRLVNKNQFLVTDAMTLSRFKDIRRNSNLLSMALDYIFILRSLTPYLSPDDELWHQVLSSMSNRTFNNSTLLSVLGYDTRWATCYKCNDAPNFFMITDQIFVCSNCSDSIPKDQILSI